MLDVHNINFEIIQFLFFRTCWRILQGELYITGKKLMNNLTIIKY
jgi:hypothetical protein